MVNYIVSGLERSGTSLMMQILERAQFPIDYDEYRKPDENNPYGYYELFDGKIIGKMIKGLVDFDDYKDRAIKITSYGLKYLPKDGRQYKILIMYRDIEEILKSDAKFKGIEEPDFTMASALINMEREIIDMLNSRNDCQYIIVNHRNLFENPELELIKIQKFLNHDMGEGIKAIDKSLWRNRNE